MNEATLDRLGLSTHDFDEEVGSKTELIVIISSSGRLFRKVLQSLIFRHLRIYLRNPNLEFSERTDKYFPYRSRWKDWVAFRNALEFNIPRLRTTSLAKTLMVGYLIFYVFAGWYLLSVYTDVSVHAILSTPAFFTLFLMGALLPTVVIYLMGQKRLPARDIGGLIDKIVAENMLDLLTMNKGKLLKLLEAELSED